MGLFIRYVSAFPYDPDIDYIGIYKDDILHRLDWSNGKEQGCIDFETTIHTSKEDERKLIIEGIEKLIIHIQGKEQNPYDGIELKIPINCKVLVGHTKPTSKIDIPKEIEESIILEGYQQSINKLSTI